MSPCLCLICLEFHTKHLRKHLLTNVRYFNYLKRVRLLSDILNMTREHSYHSTVWPNTHTVKGRACSWPEQRVKVQGGETCQNVASNVPCRSLVPRRGLAWVLPRGRCLYPAGSSQLAQGQMNTRYIFLTERSDVLGSGWEAPGISKTLMTAG